MEAKGDADTMMKPQSIGGALILLGALAMALSVMATLVSVLLVGCLLMFAGALEAARLVVSITAARRHRAWIALSGLIALALGLVVWSELPEGAVWLIGTFVGIDLVVAGWAWLMRGMALRNARVVRGPIALVLALLLGAAVAGPAAAQTDPRCGAFRVQWDRGELSPTAEKLEGFVYNDSSCLVTDVRIHVVAVSADGHPVGETLGWVYGDIPAGGRGYFVIPLPDDAAADYRVNVISFDEVSLSRAQPAAGARHPEK